MSYRHQGLNDEYVVENLQHPYSVMPYILVQ